LDEFAIQEAHREQMIQRSDNLFKILDDAPLQASLDDLDRTFSTLKQQIQVFFPKKIFANTSSYILASL
jgi:hypothetical protein